MEPEELSAGINKSDEQKLSPDLSGDMDEFFSGTSGERPVTPGQDSDTVENSNMQKQVVVPEEVINGAGDNKVYIDDDSKQPEARSSEQSDSTVKAPSDGINVQTHNIDQTDSESELHLHVPVGSGIPDSIHDPLSSKPATEHSDEVPKQEASDAEVAGDYNDREPLIDVSNADLVIKDHDGKPLEEDVDRENHIAAINIVQELLNQALEVNESEDRFRSMFHSDADDGHPSAEVIEDNGADSGSEGIHDRVGQDVIADNDGFYEDSEHDLMANSSEGLHVDQITTIQQMCSSEDVHIDQQTGIQQENGSSDSFHTDQQAAIQIISGSDLAEDVQVEDLEDNDKQITDGSKQSPTLKHPIHEINVPTSNEVSPKLKQHLNFGSDVSIRYDNSNQNSDDFLNKSDDNNDENGEPNKYGLVKCSSTGFQTYEINGSSKLTKTEDEPNHSLDRQYPANISASDDLASISHISDNLTDEDWSENERKEDSRIPALHKIEKEKEEVDPQLARRIVSGTSSSSQFEFKPPKKPTSKNLTGTHENYLQSPHTRDTGERSDISIGGSYLSGGINRDDLNTLTRPLLTDVQHSSSWSHGIPVSPPSSGPIPGYRSLQDQQISWLQMFKILEKQHRKELQSQYVEHQRLIEGIQVQMERDLQKQQDSLHQRLEVHREMLNESTASDLYTTDRHYGYRLAGGDTNMSSIHSVEEASHGHVQTSSLPVRRALDRDFDSRTPSPSRGYGSLDSIVHVSSKHSPRRSPGRSARKSPVSESRSEFVGEKMLRGEVYSTPMPISRAKNVSRSFTSKSENRSLRNIPLSSSPVMGELLNGDVIEPSLESRAQAVDSHLTSDYDDSYLASSTKLREKHIKAMADLRLYYESELQDLRESLAITVPSRESARERILQDENQELKRRCDDLEEEIYNTKIRNRDLEQKIHGLEIRANDYADRYDDSQRTVLSLKNRLEELHSYAKDRDKTIEDLQMDLKKQVLALQEAFKKEDQYSESSRREKVTLQRVLEKYEGLEKEYNILKESSRQIEDKYYDAKNEVVDLHKMQSKLELQVKQLNRENDNLRHKATVALNMASVMTSYEDSFGAVNRPRSLISSNHDNRSTSRSPVPPPASYRIAGRLTGNESQAIEDTSDTESEKSSTSPLIKAERELLKLKNQDLPQSLSSSFQKKFYGSDMSYSGKHATEYEYSKKVGQSPKYSVKQSPSNFYSKQRDRATSTPKQVTHGTRNRPSGENGGLPKTPPPIQIQPKKYPSPTRFDVEFDYRSKLDRQKGLKAVSSGDSYPTRSSNDVLKSTKSQSPKRSEGSPKSVANTLERVRAGDIVSRPQWEDVHTSMVKPKPAAEIPIASMTREQRLEERMQTIDKLEKKFEVLQAEKRKLESALTRVPTHGHLRQKEELEDQYEKVDRELGSVRMSLKRFQVIKSTI